MFADRLKGLRKKTNLTQEGAAKKLDIARTTYSGYERGTSEPDFSTLEKIADVYGVDLNWLITGRERELNDDVEKIVDDIADLDDKEQKYIFDLIEIFKKRRH